MIGIMVLGQGFREAVGEVVGILMNPILALVGQENFFLILLVMASITAIYSSLIQKYTIDWDLMRNTQERMKVFQKEFREAQLSQNTYMLKKLEEQRQAMMEDQMKMSKQQFNLWLTSVLFPFLSSCGLIITSAGTGMPRWFFLSGVNSC